MNLEDSVQFLKGVGPKKSELLNSLGIFTIYDLIRYFPRRYEDWSNTLSIQDAPNDENICIKARVINQPLNKHSKNGMRYSTFGISDNTGVISVVIFNNRYLTDKIQQGKTYLFMGKITINGNFVRQMSSPKIIEYTLAELGLQPVYPLTAGVNNNYLKKIIKQVIDTDIIIPEPLSSHIRNTYDLCSIDYAIKNIHFPKDYHSLEIAKKRLVFEEQLILRLGLSSLKNISKNKTKHYISKDYNNEYKSLLPYKLTNAQNRVINEITEDLFKPNPMCRLLQGDVGSGKTAVASAAIYNAVKNGMQCAFMAPTEILASQHFNTISKLFKDSNFTISLLCGSTNKKAKEQIYSDLSTGKTNIVIGTHALLQKNVSFKNLGLCITDEQHRFGVLQRSALTSKGEEPNLLVMSATPIPRSLALVIYGDLDLSILDEMPPNRQKINTYSVSSSYEPRIFNYVNKFINDGYQAYIVCPLVEANDELELTSVTEYYTSLKTNYFSNTNIGFLHGKMSSKEKEKIMSSFYSGETKLIVSTTVIEVGVDVPNAVIMVIKNAERFGLSQLHQLRGRVGRGSAESSCILVSDSKSDASIQRLKIMCETNDGFKIADEDLKLRGPGDFFGSRQHGLPCLTMSESLSDTKLMEISLKAADEILSKDSTLSTPENAELKYATKKLFDKIGTNTIN